jgi:hypothetical protein
MARNICWKAIVSAAAVMILTSIISIGCAFALVLAKAKDVTAAQAMLSGPFFQADLMLEGGAIGITGLVIGHLIGPFLAGFVLGYLAEPNPRIHLVIFTGVVTLLWLSGIITSPSAQGIGSAIFFTLLAIVSLLCGGYMASKKRITNGASGGTTAS